MNIFSLQQDSYIVIFLRMCHVCFNICLLNDLGKLQTLSVTYFCHLTLRTIQKYLVSAAVSINGDDNDDEQRKNIIESHILCLPIYQFSQ